MKKIILFAKSFVYIFKKGSLQTFFMIAMTIVEGIVPVVMVVVMKNIIDIVTVQPLDYMQLGRAIALWVAALTSQYAVGILLRLNIDVFIMQVSRMVSGAIIDKSNSFMGLGVFENEKFQSMFNNITKAEFRIENFINNFRYWLKSFVEFISIFVLFISFGLWVPLALFVAILPGIFSAQKIAKLETDQEDTIYELERHASYFRNTIISSTARKEMHLFNFGALFANRFTEYADKMFDENKKYRSRVAMLNFLGTFLRIIAIAGIMIILSLRAGKGFLSAGSIAMFLQSIFYFSTAMLDIIQYWSYQDSALSFFSKLFDYFNLKDEIDTEHATEPFSGTIHSIEFKSVSFTYRGKNKPAVNNVSFTLHANEILAIVGENGAGKTTLVKLLVRFYDPNSGEIFVNGKNIKDYELASYRGALSAVFQDYEKYYLKVIENITARDAVEQNPLRESHAHKLHENIDLSFVDELSCKELTELGTEFGGTEISGGQWQRLAIARGMYKSHSLMLVDEPTASIDPLQERTIYESILHKKNCMTILVTHRLGSIRKADKILVMQNGCVCGNNTHAALMEQNAYYRDLYESQAGMYV